MEKKNIPTSKDAIYAHVCDCISAWDAYASSEIKKVLALRRYFYSSAVEADRIVLSASVAESYQDRKITLSPIRQSLNRAKSDLRDQEPSLRTYQRTPSNDTKKLKVNQAILEEITLNDSTYNSLYSVADSILDMSYSIAQLVVQSKYNEQSKSLESELLVKNIPDLLSVSFDCSVPFYDINEEGAYVTFKREVTYRNEDGKNYTCTYIEHFEKIFKTNTYAKRYDPLVDKVITEKVKKGMKYMPDSKIKVREVDFIKHWVFKDSELVEDSRWPFKILPFIIGSGVVFDEFDAVDGQSKRLTIVPYAEHVVKAQDLLNQAATAMSYNLSQIRGSSKFMYYAEQIKGFEKNWKNRNTSDSDLPMNMIYDTQGNLLPIKPEPVPDIQTSPVVSEIMQTLPGQIQQLLGNEHEESINTNKSGEAIKVMQVIASKNTKLYLMGFERFLGFLGKCIEHYMPIVYDTPRYIPIKVGGQVQIQEINTRKENTIKNILNSFGIEISLGSNKQSNKDKTIAGLTSLWGATAGTDLGVQVAQSTLDIYADSLDTSKSGEISKRLSLLLPPAVQQLEQGVNTQDVIAQNNDAQANQAQTQQGLAMQQVQRENDLASAKQQSEVMKAQASLASAQGRLLSGQAAMLKAEKEGHVPPTIHINEDVQHGSVSNLRPAQAHPRVSDGESDLWDLAKQKKNEDSQRQY